MNLLQNNEKKNCKDCVNFITCRSDNQYECDYEYWGPVMYEDAVLYVPELFDCTHYENMKNIK